MQTKTNKYTVFSILAIISAFALVLADYLLEYMGMPSNEIGGMGIIESSWINMQLWRFPLSIALCGFFIPFYLLGFYVLYKEIKVSSPKAAAAYFAMTGFGIMTASLIHGMLAYMPVVYKQLIDAGHEALAVTITESIYTSTMSVFWVHYAITWIVPQILLFALIISKKTMFSRFCVLFNPITFLVMALVLKGLNPHGFEFIYVAAINKANAATFIMAFIYARRLPQSVRIPM